MFGVQPNVPLMHQVVTAQLAGRRAGTQSTKTRAEVRGGGTKPFKQKGTGNARQGSTRAPHYQRWWRRPRPEAAQVRPEDPEEDDQARAALGPVATAPPRARSSSSTRGASTRRRPRTPSQLLSALGIDGKALVVVDVDDTNTIKSFLNLPEVQLIEAGELNAYDVLCNDYIVFTKATLPGGGEVAEAGQEGRRKQAAPRSRRRRRRPQPRRRRRDCVRSDAVPAGATRRRGRRAAEGFKIKGNADSGCTTCRVGVLRPHGRRDLVRPPKTPRPPASSSAEPRRQRDRRDRGDES